MWKVEVRIPPSPLFLAMQERSLIIIEVMSNVLQVLPWPSGDSICFFTCKVGVQVLKILFFSFRKKRLELIEVMSSTSREPHWPDG